ncbi:MAG TPA: alanine racemase [Xanthobacteraceae bacterium]|nr:alanine racemase [Xanthobacteraceae bacterium]
MALAEPLPESTVPPMDPETGGTLSIDLDAIEANWLALGRELRTVECAAVVKANAYGLGLEPVAAKLAKAGCKTFFVADLAEARRLRLRARDATIYVLNGFLSEAATAFVELNVRPVINSASELAEWDAFVTAQDWRGGAAIHVDTGMNRLGVSPEEAAALALRLQNENHGITLLMSHLACAEIAGHPLSTSQIRLFRELRLLYHGVPASLANSSGIFLGDSAHFDMARPGAALYGLNPTPGRANPVRNVVELNGRILQLRKVARGDTVGYGATWTAKRPSRLAVVALGYADGLMRAASGTGNREGASAIIGGRRCPVAGLISMDLVCIDITELEERAVHRGDLATFIGENIPVEEIAQSAGTIGYEILTRLGPRCHLVYRGG